MYRPQITVNGKFLNGPLNGVHRTALEYATALIDRAAGQCDVRLVAPRPVAASEDFPGLQVEAHPGRFGAGQGWEMLTLPRAARRSLLLNLCNLAPLAHRNSVVMIHDAQTFLHPEDYGGLQGAAYRTFLPWIGRRARRVLTVSDFARASLGEHRIAPPDRIVTVHNGTDHILRPTPDRSVLDRHGLTDGGYVLVLGTTKGYKNIHRVFKAMETPAPGGLRLVVAGGPGEQKYRDRGWHAPSDTVFTGFVSDAELRALYTSARVFAFPSLTEGFGLPPLEAMHCGTPVIASRAGAMIEVCGDAALFAEPDDTAAWREGIERLAGPEGQTYAARGNVQAARFTWTAAGDRLWSVIAPLVGIRL
ncbi:MAG: glycosyltransferase family 1 protein [Pseudomonadota bacterium]